MKYKQINKQNNVSNWKFLTLLSHACTRLGTLKSETEYKQDIEYEYDFSNPVLNWFDYCVSDQSPTDIHSL